MKVEWSNFPLAHSDEAGHYSISISRYCGAEEVEHKSFKISILLCIFVKAALNNGDKASQKLSFLSGLLPLFSMKGRVVFSRSPGKSQSGGFKLSLDNLRSALNEWRSSAFWGTGQSKSERLPKKVSLKTAEEIWVHRTTIVIESKVRFHKCFKERQETFMPAIYLLSYSRKEKNFDKIVNFSMICLCFS